eukprot:1586454-Pyramimonas_sp.AAC.1
MRSCAQYSVSWPHRELHRRSQWRSSHAVLAPSTAFLGPIGRFTEGPTGGHRMRFLCPVHRCVAPERVPRKVPVAEFACGSPA